MKFKLLSLALLALPTLAHAADPLPPLQVSPNGRYFVQIDPATRTQKPFFYLGDTAWTLFNHPTPADVDHYLDDRAKKGFNVIQACVAVWDHRTRPNPDGHTPFLNNDPATPNPAFFTNVDQILDKAAARNMYVALLPFWTKNTRTGPFAEPAKMKPYAHFLAKRYASRNLIWVLGGDTAGADIQPVTDAMAAGLLQGAKESGLNDLFITYHPTGRQSSSFWFHDRPWLDFNAIQSGHFINTNNFRLVADDWNKQPIKPTLDTEPGYENITDNLVRTNVTTDTPRIKALDVRRAAYLAVFAGAAGHTYGNGEVYEFWSPPSQGGRGNMPGWAAQLPWKESLLLPASGQLQHLKHLIESRPMLDRIPDQSMIVGEVSNRATERIQATRAADGSYAFIYVPALSAITVNLSKISSNTVSAHYFNPRTGESTKFGPISMSEAHTFSPPLASVVTPDASDWVLVLDDATRKFDIPGKISNP